MILKKSENPDDLSSTRNQNSKVLDDGKAIEIDSFFNKV